MRKVLKTITALAMTGAMAFASIPGSALLQVESVWAAEHTVINSTSGTIKYDGTPKTLATYEVAEGHPITYAVVDSSYTGDVPANASEILEISSGSGVITPGYSISDPTTSVQYIQATDVGTYRVFCSIDGNINNIGGITINPGDASIAFPTSAPTTKKVGDANFSLAVTKTPSTADGTVAYSGGDAGIATIDSSGEVTIVGPGEATFTATVTPGTNYSYATTTISHTLTVLPNISAVNLTPATADLTIGSSPVSLTGDITVSPNDDDYKKVKWSVSGSGVKLYSDSGCTTEISSDETSTLAVYAKASESTTPGSYAVTMTSASDSLKTDTATLTVNGWPEVTATTAPTSTLPQTWGVNDEDVIRVDLGTPTVSGSTITYKPTGVIPKNNQTVTFAGAERTSGHYVAFQLNATEPEYSAGIRSATLTVSGTEGDKEYQLADVKDYENGKTTSVVAVVRVDDAITAKKRLMYKFDFDGGGTNSAAEKFIVIDPSGLTYAEDATDLTNYTATLTGNTKVGSTLTATLTDGKNTIPASDLEFEWVTADGDPLESSTTIDEIDNTGYTFKVTTAEKGKYVGVRVHVKKDAANKYTGSYMTEAWTASKVTAPSTPSDDTTPSDPTPTDPTPTDPTPVDPTPVDPTPVDPTPVDPTPGPEVPDDPSSDKTPAETPETKTEVDPSTGAETTTTTVKNTDDSITTKTETTLPDGASTETIRVDEVNGDYEQSYVEKDKDGNVVESATESQTTDAATGDVTSLTVKETTEGTTTETRTEKPNGDFEEKTTVASPEGLITESHEASKVTQSDGTIIEKTTEVKNGVTVETEKKTDATGATTQSEKTTAADGSSEQVTQETDASGAVTTISRTSVDKDGKGYTISGTMDADGNMRVNVVSDTKADELTIPDTVTDMDGKSHDVTELGEGSVPPASDITVGQNVNSVLKGAFSYVTTPKMKLTFQGPIKKGMFAKGAFQPELQKLNSTNGKKKAGNNITIFVQSKKDMKQMKKQLKKAGIPGAKVKVEK